MTMTSIVSRNNFEPKMNNSTYNHLNYPSSCWARDPNFIEKAVQIHRSSAGKYSFLLWSNMHVKQNAFYCHVRPSTGYISLTYAFLSAICDASFTWKGQLPWRMNKNPFYSCKVSFFNCVFDKCMLILGYILILQCRDWQVD